MSWYDDRRGGHGYFSVHEQIAELLPRLLESEDRPLKIELGQMWAVLATIRTRIDQIPAAFVPLATLASLRDATESIREGLAQLEADRTEDSARTALTRLDEVVTRATPILATGTKPESVSEAIAEAARALAEERERLRARTEHAVQELRSVQAEATAELEAKSQATQDAVATARADLATAQEQMTAGVQQRTTEFVAAFEATKVRIDSSHSTRCVA
ncbi:MAG: hypothetical protein O3C25_04670 [Chloroflexi bacterium]|nr:hypothetical protein [Chloroflexota bacterium]